MDRKHIDDQHVVARYLADQLSDSDREAFEAYCSANPEMFREIEAAARFKVGLAKLEEKNELKPIIEGAAKPARPAAYRLAAALAGLVIGGVAIYGAVVSLRVPAMGATVAEVSGRFRDVLPIVAHAEVMKMRTSIPEPTIIELPATVGSIELRVLPEPETADSYRATLRSSNAGQPATIAVIDALKPDELRFVTIYLNTQIVQPGTYSILVVPSGRPESEAAELPLEIRKASPEG